MDKANITKEDKINAVTKMQKYIQDNLQNQITQLELAKVSGYSPFYAVKVFKELIGKTPFEYIRKLRLSSSAIILRDERTKIIDVAFDFVFDSHEGFTRAFSREFGLTPKAYAKNPKPIQLFMPYPVRGYYQFVKNRKEGNSMDNTNANTIFVQVIERPERQLILKRGKSANDYFEYCEEVGCEIWGILTSVKEALYEPIGMWMPDNLRPEGTSIYTQGVEVPIDYCGEIPKGFEMIKLPPCKMLIFQGQPYDDDIFCEAINDLWKQTANYKPEIYGFEWDDALAPKFQLMPMGYRGYIEGRPVKVLTK